MESMIPAHHSLFPVLRKTGVFTRWDPVWRLIHTNADWAVDKVTSVKLGLFSPIFRIQKNIQR
jgi:hypothetical protein